MSAFARKTNGAAGGAGCSGDVPSARGVRNVGGAKLKAGEAALTAPVGGETFENANTGGVTGADPAPLPEEAISGI